MVRTSYVSVYTPLVRVFGAPWQFSNVGIVFG